MRSLLATCLIVFCASPLVGADDRPNVLFIAADDLRCDLPCYGNQVVKAPHIEALARRGIVFQRAYCQQALCNPSRTSLLTGLRPDTLEIWDLPTHFRTPHPDVVTLPEAFKQQGYFTQDVGKIYHNWIHEVHGDPQSWSVPAQLHFANHGHDKPVVDGPLPENLAQDRKCERRDVPDEAYYDGRVAKLAEEAIAEIAKRDQPFFLAVGFWKPHSPFNAPGKYWDMYERRQIPVVENDVWPAQTPRIAWHNSREILGTPARELTAAAAQEIRHGYYANISYLDAQVGRVLSALRSHGLADNTIIVFWSDHGYHLGEHTLWAKTSNFELDARVPMIIVPPGDGFAQGHTESIAELVDLYPTLTELCGVESPGNLEGTSLVPVLKDLDAKVKSAALTVHPRPAYYKDKMDALGRSLRTEQFRYTEWREPESGTLVGAELYDHKIDPAESKNRLDDPAYRRVLPGLRQQLRAFSR